MLIDQSIRHFGTLLNFVRHIIGLDILGITHPAITLSHYVLTSYFMYVWTFSHSKRQCASWCWCSPTGHTTAPYMTACLHVHELLNNNYWKAPAELVYKKTTQCMLHYSSELVSKINEMCYYSSCDKIYIGSPMLYEVTEYDTVHSTKYQLVQGSQWSTIQTSL